MVHNIAYVNIETLGVTMIGHDEHIHIYMKKNSCTSRTYKEALIILVKKNLLSSTSRIFLVPDFLLVLFRQHVVLSLFEYKKIGIVS